jgi:hypothetical protein
VLSRATSTPPSQSLQSLSAVVRDAHGRCHFSGGFTPAGYEGGYVCRGADGTVDTGAFFFALESGWGRHAESN